jgi:tetratricopeptide (TPR) repeat protein
MALLGAGSLAWCQGDFPTARFRLEESLAILRELGDRRGLARALVPLGAVIGLQGDLAAARSLEEESLTIWQELAEPAGIAGALFFLAGLARARGDLVAARSHFEESVAIQRQLGNQSQVAVALFGWGSVALLQGDTAAARSLLEESLSLRREFGAPPVGAIWSQCLLGLAVLADGDEDLAVAHFKESLERAQEAGSGWATPAGLEGLARVAAAHGQAERAARLFGATAAWRSTPALLRMSFDPAGYDHLVSTARAALGEEAFAAAWAAGQAMPLEEAVRYALQVDEA